MSQHDQVIDDGPGLAVRTDFNAALAALFSSSSGAVEPTVKVAGQLWFDTSTALLKLRNNANDAWLSLVVGAGAGFLPLAGGTLTGPLILAADPIDPLGAATKQSVASTLAATGTKAAVRLTTNVNNALSGLTAVDSVTPVAGNRILVAANTLPAENGIYIAAAGLWARAADMDTWGEVTGATVWVQEGTVNKNTGWVSIAPVSGTIGTDAIVFTKYAGPGVNQPTNAFLTSIAALVADGMVRKVGNVASVIDLTTAANYISNAAERILATNEVWSAAQEITLAYAATMALDNRQFINAYIEVTGALALSNWSNVILGRAGCIRLNNTSGAAVALTFGTNLRFPAGATKPATLPTGESLLYYYVSPNFIALSIGSTYA